MKEKFEYLLWTELLAFEKNDPDYGAARYLDSIPQKPDAVFLFICHADFPFSHNGMEKEYELSPAVCSRNAHPRNEQRERQRWTNWELRALIANMRKREVPVYLSMFTCHYYNEFGPEWLSQHPEPVPPFGDGWRFDSIAVMDDGTKIEAIFAPRLASVCQDYGFAGFHGADRFNGNGVLFRGMSSDNITKQFLERTGLNAPDYVTAECGHDPDLRQKRTS